MTSEVDQLAQAHWDARKAAINLSGCRNAYGRLGKQVKGFRPADEYMAEALEQTEQQLSDALRVVRAMRARCAT